MGATRLASGQGKEENTDSINIAAFFPTRDASPPLVVAFGA